ncbi:TPA: hypothetical protein I8Y99_000673 [Legionella pneumophila]|nr:hypothetical protein [Legionella pneumophila]
MNIAKLISSILLYTTRQNIRLFFYSLFIFFTVLLWSTYFKLYSGEKNSVNFYVKSILTLKIWNQEDYHAGWRWSTPWGHRELKPVEFKKTNGKFDPFGNENAYFNLSRKYWDKLASANSADEQNAIYQKALRELQAYYQAASSWHSTYDKFIAFSLVASVLSVFLFLAFFVMNSKIRLTIVEDMNKFKANSKKIMLKAKALICNTLFKEEFFKRNVIIILILILMTLLFLIIGKE